MNTENTAKGENKKESTAKKQWKKWEKPVFITVRADELKKYIRAAARSGGCWGSVMR